MEPSLSPSSEAFSNYPIVSYPNTSYANTAVSNSAPSTPRPRGTTVLQAQNQIQTRSPLISRKPYGAGSRTNSINSNSNGHSKELRKRHDLAIRVITQPSATMAVQTVATQGWVPPQQDVRLVSPLPETWTDLLMRLYEAVIQAKNCEIPVDRFWSQYDCSPHAFRNMPYSRQGIEHTLATIGVECSTQSQGKQVTTGRWLLLRHGHFLLRSQHTITWVESATQPQPSEQTVEFTPVVWDWRSGAEKWRWHTWQESMFVRYTPEGEFQMRRDEEQDIIL